MLAGGVLDIGLRATIIRAMLPGRE